MVEVVRILLLGLFLSGCSIHSTYRTVPVVFCEQRSFDTVCPGYDRGAFEGYNNIDYIREGYNSYGD